MVCKHEDDDALQRVLCFINILKGASILDSSFNVEVLGSFRNFKHSNGFVYFLLYLRYKFIFYILYCLIYEVLYIVFIASFYGERVTKEIYKKGSTYRNLNCIKTKLCIKILSLNISLSAC